MFWLTTQYSFLNIAISFNFMKQNKHFNKSIVFWIYKTFNMIIILKGTIDAYKATKDFRENHCISSDVILMFDEMIEKLLHDASYYLSDVNSIRLDNVAGNIAPKLWMSSTFAAWTSWRLKMWLQLLNINSNYLLLFIVNWKNILISNISMRI